MMQPRMTCRPLTLFALHVFWSPSLEKQFGGESGQVVFGYVLLSESHVSLFNRKFAEVSVLEVHFYLFDDFLYIGLISLLVDGKNFSKLHFFCQLKRSSHVLMDTPVWGNDERDGAVSNCPDETCKGEWEDLEAFEWSTSTLCRVLCPHRGVVKKDIGSLPEKEEWSGSLPGKEDISSLPEKEEWSGSLSEKEDIGSLPEKEEWSGSLPEKEDIGSLPEKEEYSGSLPEEGRLCKGFSALLWEQKERHYSGVVQCLEWETPGSGQSWELDVKLELVEDCPSYTWACEPKPYTLLCCIPPTACDQIQYSECSADLVEEASPVAGWLSHSHRNFPSEMKLGIDELFE
ncbi:hypothetical protein M5K25_007222 [Dendrobium thyrsiflorum]|uniref:Uncharacterized protein n=1 Tax=Dendrobium thyrsiflorum TaxID=117978 RepID=A0ABD0VDD2_DENTH